MRYLIAIFLLGIAAFAPARAQEVEVATVNFSNVRAPTGSNGTWHSTEITLTVKAVPGNPSQMVSRVRVSLLQGFELPATAAAERRLEHYRSEAECVALEPGRAYLRFYLPPELVKRDQLRSQPKFWGVEITVEGRPMTPSSSAYSTTLGTAVQRKNFQTRGGAAAAVNDGILLPQYLTPFVDEHPRATPSFVRRDAR